MNILSIVAFFFMMYIVATFLYAIHTRIFINQRGILAKYQKRVYGLIYMNGTTCLVAGWSKNQTYRIYKLPGFIVYPIDIRFFQEELTVRIDTTRDQITILDLDEHQTLTFKRISPKKLRKMLWNALISGEKYKVYIPTHPLKHITIHMNGECVGIARIHYPGMAMLLPTFFPVIRYGDRYLILGENLIWSESSDNEWEDLKEG